MQEYDKALLVSIRPQFVKQILSGDKKVEFRRSWVANPVESIVIYSTSPEQMMVASAKVSKITEARLVDLWGLCQEKGGDIKQKDFDKYYIGKESGFAIELASVNKFKFLVDPRKIFKDFHPPQAFKYISASEYFRIIKYSEGGNI
jgi:predicted transcriptional regulator